MKAKCLRMYILLCALFAAGSLGAQQLDVKARIAGLEKNGEYMSLLREDALLQAREDSVVRVVEQIGRASCRERVCQYV